MWRLSAQELWCLHSLKNIYLQQEHGLEWQLATGNMWIISNFQKEISNFTVRDIGTAIHSYAIRVLISISIFPFTTHTNIHHNDSSDPFFHTIHRIESKRAAHAIYLQFADMRNTWFADDISWWIMVNGERWIFYSWIVIHVCAMCLCLRVREGEWVIEQHFVFECSFGGADDVVVSFYWLQLLHVWSQQFYFHFVIFYNK